MNSEPQQDDGLSRELCLHILQRLGEGGQPPDRGVELINVGTDKYLDILENEYLKLLLRSGSSFKLVQGYFGGGKTHFLYCLREVAWQHRYVTAVVELSPTECPYDDSLKVYGSVARRLCAAPAQEWAQPTYGFVDLLRDVVDDKLELANSELVTEWLRRTVGRATCESHSFRHAVMQFGLAYLADDVQQQHALGAWLAGEDVPPQDVRPLGVYDTMTRANAFTMLRCLCQMMLPLGFAGTVLLFDEVDRNLSVSARRSHVIGDNLRQVIDLCGRHQLPSTLFVYAVPPEFLRNVVPDYPALYQRLRSPLPLSVRSPHSVLIDLEYLDLEPVELLTRIGLRIKDIFETARDVGLETALQRRNARTLAEACVQMHFEVNHRRLFVKTWLDLLYKQLTEGEMLLTKPQAAEAVEQGFTDLTEQFEES